MNWAREERFAADMVIIDKSYDAKWYVERVRLFLKDYPERSADYIEIGFVE